MNAHARRIATAVALMAGLATIVVAGQGSPGAAQMKNPVASTAESVSAGKQIYLRRCASCHAASGEGGPGNDLIPAAPSLVDAQWDHGASDGEIFDSIKNGVGPDFNMVPFKDTLKDDEIWNVVDFVYQLGMPKPEKPE